MKKRPRDVTIRNFWRQLIVRQIIAIDEYIVYFFFFIIFYYRSIISFNIIHTVHQGFSNFEILPLTERIYCNGTIGHLVTAVR